MSSHSIRLLSGAAAVCASGVTFLALSDRETDDECTMYQVLGSLGAGITAYLTTTAAFNIRAWMERRGGENAEGVARGLEILNNADPVLVAQENRNTLIQSRANANYLASGLRILNDADPALVTQENRNALIQSGANANYVAAGLRSLNNADPALITQENRDALIQSGANAMRVALGLTILNNANPALVTQENRDTLIQSGENAHYVAFGLTTLNDTNPALITQENRDALIQSSENGMRVVAGLKSLNNADPALVTQENFDALLAGNGVRAQRFSLELPNWQATHPGMILNEEHFHSIMRTIDELEWEPCRDAAAILGQRNRLIPDNLRLPPELIGRIVGYLAAPDLPRNVVNSRAWDIASKVEDRSYSHNNEL